MAEIPQKYSIGIPEMDAQHAVWIQLIERFRQTASDHMTDATGQEAAEVALQEMLEYTKRHFVSEEQFMANHHYPNVDSHKRRHGELIVEVNKLLDEIRAHRVHSTPLKLNLFVTVWLFDHIMEEDIRYARFILGKGMQQDHD